MKKTKLPPKNRWQRILSHRWVQICLATLITLILLTITAKWWNPVVFPPVENPRMGVTFSARRSAELGLDWKANYVALLDDMKIRDFRLMSFWDAHEVDRGKFDFSTLDWQINEASKRGARVSLAIGLRQPRWPECHQPEWATKLDGGAWKQALYSYMQIVIKRYENNPTVINWQLENEGMNNWFGACPPPDRQRLIEEFNMVRSMSRKPIWMSLSDQHGLPIGQPWPDKFGYSVYRVVWNNSTPPFNFYLLYPTPIWYHQLRRVAIKLITGRDIYVHELQLEPWGPKDSKDLSIEEQDKSMDLDRIRDNLLFGRELGAHEIYTWGGEWWYWRLKNGDPTVWNTVREEFEALR